MSSRRRIRRVGCAATALALTGPRLALALVWALDDVVQTAFQTVLFPLVGIIVLPLTALAYSLAAGPAGSVGGPALVWPALGLVADAAVLGFGVYWGVEYRLE